MAGRRSGSSRRSGPRAPAVGQRDGRSQSVTQASSRADSVTEPVPGRPDARPTPGRADTERASHTRNERGATRPAADADPEAIARRICLRLLSVAPRTQAELADALRRRGVPAEAAAAVLTRFAEVKLIDDELFARAWVESRHHGRGLSGRVLGAELRQRGVASAEIEAALGQLSPDQELATARELIQHRLAATAGLPAPARVRRLMGVLARKGYSPGLAYRIVREALEQEPGSDSVPSYDLEIFPEPDEEEAPAEAW